MKLKDYRLKAKPLKAGGSHHHPAKISTKGSPNSNEKWLEGFIVKGRHILGVRSDLLESLEIEPVFVRLKD